MRDKELKSARPKHHSASEWRGLVEEWQKSGQSPEEFAAAHGVTVKTLRGCDTTLRTGRGLAPSPKKPRVKGLAVKAHARAPRMVALRVEPAPPQGPRWELQTAPGAHTTRTPGAQPRASQRTGRLTAAPLENTMIRWPGTLYVATEPVNLHASFDALNGFVRARLRREPREDALFIFHNQQRTLIKMIWHDGSGYCVFAKRIDRGTYRIPLAIPHGATHVTVTERELTMLLEGLGRALLRAARRAVLTE